MINPESSNSQGFFQIQGNSINQRYNLGKII